MSDDPSTPSDDQPDETPTIASTPPAEPVFTAGTTQWSGPLRYGMGIVLIAICVAGLLLILPLLQIILLSFLIAFIMFIPSRALSRRTRLPYGLSVVVSFLIAAAIAAGLTLLLLPDLRYLAGGVKNSTQQLYTYLETNNFSSLQPLLPLDAATLLADIVHLAFGFFGNLAGLAAAIGTASVVALFFLIGLPITGGTMTNWVPAKYSREIALLFGKLDVLWLKFFRALIIIGVITGAASLGLFELFGINGALLLAVVTATVGLIPVVGRIVAILLIFATAYINGSTRFVGLDNLVFAVLTIIAYLIVTQTIGTIVSPKLKGSAINVPVVAIVVGVMVGLNVAGIVGALLVAPIIGSFRVFMQYSVAKILLREPYPGEGLPPPQNEGFFSHMLYVKKRAAESATE